MISKRNAAHDDRLARAVTAKNRAQVKWGELIGPDECPMMRRWVLVTPLGSLRLHHFLRSDNDRQLHDHPWWFLTLVLRGRYVDEAEIDGERRLDKLRPGSVRWRPALHRHAVKTDGCWTLIITGRIGRQWGFWDRGVFLPVAEYFRRYGYAPCED